MAADGTLPRTARTHSLFHLEQPDESAVTEVTHLHAEAKTGARVNVRELLQVMGSLGCAVKSLSIVHLQLRA